MQENTSKIEPQAALKPPLLPSKSSYVFSEMLRKSYWLFVKELQSFTASNFPVLSLVFIYFLCGLVSILAHRLEVQSIDLSRMLFHLFYIIFLVGGALLALTSFTHEKRQGTLELLYTLPITDTQIVLAKFAMGVLSILSLALPVSIVYIYWLGETPSYAVWTGGLGLSLVGLYAYSVGIWTSSWTPSYILSAVSSALILVSIDMLGYLSGLFPAPFRAILSHFHGLERFFAFTHGGISLRSVVFFVSLILLFLFLSIKVLEARRWKGEMQWRLRK